MTDYKLPKRKVISSTEWVPFQIQNGLLLEVDGEYGSDKFPRRFNGLRDFEAFMSEDQSDYHYDGVYVLLPVVTRRTVMA